MSSRLIPLLAAPLFLSAVIVPSASAKELLSADIDVNGYATAYTNGGNASTSAELHASATSSRATASTSEDRGNATSSVENDNGPLEVNAHASAVATLVHTLLAVADREGGIGAQVRLVAQSQNDAASTTAQAITNIENRGFFTTLLFGSDKKSLAIIQGEARVAESNITLLTQLRDQATDTNDKAALTEQINALNVLRAKLAVYANQHAHAFSLFGWLF